MERKRVEKRLPHTPWRKVGAGTGGVAVGQLSELFFRGRGRGANQSVGRDNDGNSGVGSTSSHTSVLFEF